MKIPTRSLFALAAALTITLGLSGCGSDFHARIAFLQDEASVAIARPANAFKSHPAAAARRGHAHLRAGAKKLGQAVSVDIGSGSEDVYVGDLSGHVRLLAAGYDISSVELSSDGTKIVASAYDPVSEYYQIYVGDSRLQTLTQLTSDSIDHYDATISPDGTMVAYDAYDSGSLFYQLYTVPADGSADPTMVDILAPAYDYYLPAFTPDGSQLVYTGWDLSNYFLGVVDIEGTSLVPTLLTASSPLQWDGFPSVSPDGTVAFLRDDINGFNIDVLPLSDPLGTPTALTDDGESADPMYVDNKIIYLNDTPGPVNIFKMNPDGSDQRQMTHSDLTQFFNDFIFFFD